MADLSLAGVEAATLTQGVTFLYAQAGELLRRRRDAKERAAEARCQADAATDMPSAAAAKSVVPAETAAFPLLQLPDGVFQRGGDSAQGPAPAVVERLASDLFRARRDVDDYVMGDSALDPRSAAVLQAVGQLRSVLEEIYSTTLTFCGEQRPASRPTATRIQSESIGVSISGTAYIHGDVAGRDINKRPDAHG